MVWDHLFPNKLSSNESAVCESQPSSPAFPCRCPRLLKQHQPWDGNMATFHLLVTVLDFVQFAPFQRWQNPKRKGKFVFQLSIFKGNLLVSVGHILLMEEIRRSPVEVGSLSHHLQSFIHPRWCRISSINSTFPSGFHDFGSNISKRQTKKCFLKKWDPWFWVTTEIQVTFRCLDVLLAKWNKISPT